MTSIDGQIQWVQFDQLCATRKWLVEAASGAEFPALLLV